MSRVKKTIEENKKTKRTRRLVIGLIVETILAICILASELAFGTISYLASSIRTYAYYNESTETYELSSFQQLVDYSVAYNASHANDKVLIAFGDSDTSGELTGYKSIGTQENPFNGTLYIASGMTLNLPTTMFEAITDKVQILDSSTNDPVTLVITRTRVTENEPLFAKKVTHDEDSDGANWIVQYDRYYNPDTSSFYTYNIAGFIGTLCEEADVSIAIIYNNSADSKTSNIVSKDDVGLVCCSMEQKSKLTIGSITQTYSKSSNSFNISSTLQGHAGGLVGSMGDGSWLTLGAGLTNPQGSGQSISATSGYAGGIVGYCDGGTIVFNNIASYSVSQLISGSDDNGSGGVAGYYNTVSDYAPDNSRYTISTSKFSITNSCKVNGGGDCGGIFGELFNDGLFTINGANAVSVDHNSGSAKTYGGLIGNYSSNVLANTLKINTTAVHLPTRSGGNATQYGGIIGEITDDSYVEFDSVSVTSQNSSALANFGGLVGKASEGFIKLTGINTIGYSGVSTETTFAGVVGDLESGVLYLTGTTNLSATPAVTSASLTSGQIVGYRDNGLVFAKNDWSLTRSTNVQKLDDIGSWGEVVRFNGTTLQQENVLSIQGHYVTLSPAVTTINSLADFVKTALNIKLNNSQNEGVLRCSGLQSSALLGTNISLNCDIDLRGTGIIGLTRDNGEDNVQYTGTFNAGGRTITLAIGEDYGTGSNSDGKGKIYRHKYIGLFGITSGATVQNLNISKDSSIKVEALRSESINDDKVDKTTYIGNVVGQALNNLTLFNVKIKSDDISTPTEFATIITSGTKAYVGGLVGGLASAGTVNINGNSQNSQNTQYYGFLNNSATDSHIGGLIGVVSEDNSFTIVIDSSTIGGKITSSVSGNQVGGAIATIEAANANSSGRLLKINNVNISGLAMNVTGESGGLLGHKWYRTDVEFNTTRTMGVTVDNASSITTTSNTAGLVHTATGYWKVNGNGINLSSMSVTANSATSFGLLVNKGIDTSAIYLELAPSSYAVDNHGVSLSLNSVQVFDEIVAYSASGDIESNGQGVVSIATTDHALLKMDDANTGLTYKHQTQFLDDHSALRLNNHTRYYYNLDAYRTTQTNAKQQLLIWSVRQYANSSIKDYFDYTSNTIGTNSDTDLNMRGYSYYPVDLTGSLTLKGKVCLYNKEFDTSETSTTDSRNTDENSQHYLMHNALFRNISGALNADLKLDGNVKKIGNYCGVIAMGTVGSNASASPARVSINGLVLDGFKIEGTISSSDFKPLLINKSGSNAVIDIKNVSNNTTSYMTMGAGANTPAYIASSLLGNIGTDTATGVVLNFDGIKLDGRNAVGVTNLPSLDGVYHSKGSLFSKSTLVDTFSYANNSGSYGVYNYTQTDDWGGSPANRKVTYGYEIIGTEENKNTNNSSKQNKYNNSDVFTNPTTDNASSQYDNFTLYFQRYVNTAYVTNGTKHELRVNISVSTTMTGCGTYNDPYVLKTGTDIENIARLINGTFTENTYEINVPTAITDNNKSVTWCENKNSHTKYTTFARVAGNRDSSTWTSENGNKTIKDSTLGEYLARAYYQLDPEVVGGYTLTSGNQGFEGISNCSEDKYIFRGVIDGTGHTIINNSNNPLIISSYGSVIYNLIIDVQPDEPKNLTQNSVTKFTTDNSNQSKSCEAYGAVIGKIFGGDNIIDSVSVKFSTTNKIINANTNTAKKAQLVPIGGYVGVVVNGGLIFRNMTGTADNNQAGITSDSLTGFGTGVGDNPSDPTAVDNTKWLYVNPIIGRVLNGYAVTESGTFKPFEDGTRTYPDGSGVVFNGTGYSEVDDISSYSGIAVGVTMRNGTKNYSITDISTSDTSSFNMTGIDDDSDIEVSNAQGVYIMSLITQSGLGKSTTGAYTQKNELKPYSSNMATHNEATYHYVGRSDEDAVTDHGKTSSDKYAGITDKIPYIIKKYTNTLTIDQSNIYPAFDVMGDKDHFFNLIIGTGSATTLYLPDNYRGIGSLMLGVDMGNSELDDFKNNVVFLCSMSGNGNTVSENMNLTIYAEDNYPVLNGNQAFFKTGFGFIDCLQSKTNNEKSFNSLTIKGSVKYAIIDQSNGKHVDYISTYVKDGRKNNPAVAAFIGVPVAEKKDSPTPYNVTTNNINIDGMDISGIRYAGGIIGALNVAGTFSFNNCIVDNIKVIAGGAAGGLMGYMRNGSAKVEVNDCEFGIISIVSAYSNDNSDLGANSNAGAGGLIGNRQSGAPINTKNITISNVIVKNGSSVNQGYIGYYDNKQETNKSNPTIPSAGGLVGQANSTSIISANGVTIKNINICGVYAGGMVGHLLGNDSCATFKNSSVITDNGSKIESLYDNDNSASGGFIGNNSGPAQSEFDVCSLIGYTISGYKNVGGLIGINSNENTTKIIANNIDIENHSLKGANRVGGLVGYHQYGQINGYNILINNQDIDEGIVANYGYIVGVNNNNIIKLVGFSRQGTIDVAKMVGNKGIYESDRYGTGGYVIFADYDGTSSIVSNDEFSNMLTVGTNVGMSGYMEVKSKAFKVKVSGTTIHDGRLDETDYTNLPNEELDDNYGINPVIEYSGCAISKLMTLEGVYIYADKARNSASQGYYSSSINGNGALVPADNSHPKAVWFFEPCTGGYKIYTIINGIRSYLLLDSSKVNSGIKVGLKYSTTDGDVFKVGTADISSQSFTETVFSIGDVFLQNYDGNHTKYFQYSGSGSGLRYHTDLNNAGKIRLESAGVSDSRYRKTSYNSILIDGSTITPGDPITITDASSDEIAEFESIIDSNTDVLYKITEICRQNKYQLSSVDVPFVTTNPKTYVTDEQFLTGDGVSNNSYYGSVVQNIITGINTNKGYVNTGLDESKRGALTSYLSEKMSSIKGVVTSDIEYSGKDFPILVIDDLSSANETINNYLKLLTNTSYDFYNGYSDGTTYIGDDKYIYNVSITKWIYNSVTGEFDMQDGEASLKCIANDRFYITPTEVDNHNWQFSLIDVQFYDPEHTPSFNMSNNEKENNSQDLIAYHLYVPVMVKKMMHYSVQIRLAPTTSYRLTDYPSTYANLLENLGNPVTMLVTYTYHETAAEWAEAINGGESVYRNYTGKSLDIKAFRDDGEFPEDAMVILLDPNNNADKFYSGSLSGVLTNGIEVDAGTMTYKLKLNNTTFAGFVTTKLNDLMVISLDEDAEIKNLVEASDEDDDVVAVINDGSLDDELLLRYKRSGETGEYAVSVSLKDYQNNGEYVQENYYISIFTKVDEDDTDIYHYEIKSTGTSFGDSSYPSAKVGTPEVPHLFLGNLFTNSITISETNDNRVMSERNLSLSANLEATVGFTTNAINKQITSYLNNDNVKVYQTFLVSLNRLNGPGEASQHGILIDPNLVVPSNYTIDDEDPTSYILGYTIRDGYIVLTNECNIRDYLKEAAEGGERTVTVKESVSFSYSPSALSTQFPKSNEEASVYGTDAIGTYMIGYSNISSTNDGGVSSKASVNTDGTTRKCYYIEDDSSVIFSYNVITNEKFANDGNGNYGQLGIDGKELDNINDYYVQIKSAARYDINPLAQKSLAEYVVIKIKLSKKEDNYLSALDISDYLFDLQLIGKDDPETENVDESIISMTSSEDNIYTYIVPIENLQTLSDYDFYIPIWFKVYSGDNEHFEQKVGDMQYSNYKVLVTVGLLQTEDGAIMTDSNKFDHIIYTNAKLHGEVIDR